ncbi:hypothetical protein O5629_28385, partial [Escherichia coli]|nr:hypothetical protein [Escherichia coli]
FRSSRMMKLINAMMNIISSVIKVMYSAVALLNHSMEKNNIERRIKAPSMPLFVNCDELGLEQIFSNLISNALDSM